MSKSEITIQDLDRLVNVNDLAKFFGKVRANEIFINLASRLPTQRKLVTTVAYARGHYCIINRPRMVHIRLTEIYKAFLYMLENEHRDQKINMDTWFELERFVKTDMLEAYIAIKLERGEDEMLVDILHEPKHEELLQHIYLECLFSLKEHLI